MILDIFFLQFLGIVLADFELSNTIFDNGQSLERYERWSRGRWSKTDDRPPACDQKHRTEATPFAAIILSRTSGNFLCMGSILGAYYVLTVRECLLRDDLEDILVLAGYLSAWWGKDSQVKRVAEVVKSDDELAILKLQKKLRFSKQVKPIRLSMKPASTTIDAYGNELGVVGIVRAPWDVPGEPMPKSAYYDLKFVTPMGTEDKEKCSSAYADVMFNETSMFCTYANVSYCWGNLGSPTVALIDNEHVQMGIVVRAYCLDGPVPNLHLRIDTYEGWIRSNTDARSKV